MRLDAPKLDRAILRYLRREGEPRTEARIGTDIGCSSGWVADAMHRLEWLRLVESVPLPENHGRDGFAWRLTGAGREAAKEARAV
jgi:DNA-binding MarR family transcriptional regulator